MQYKNYLSGFVFTFLLPLFSWSQNVTISGSITDAQDKPLIAATVVLQHPWGEMVKADVTNANGQFTISDIEKGGYILEINYLGYETRRHEIQVLDKDLKVGRLVLTSSSVLLESVEVTEKAAAGTQMDDTLQFNAGAYKVMKDASTEDLVGKLPSVQVEGGVVKIQGENVGQVLVDGKPFFGNDPTAALRNLPAEVVDKIQIFDQASEQSQFSGIQDGNTVKTINIVTRSDMRAGQFGKIYAGYGTDNRFQTGGNINIFNGDRRISLIGMSNNINVQNFAADDILGVLGQSSRGGPSRGGGGNQFRGNSGANDFLVSSRGGISTTTAFGLNYSDNWSKKVEVTGSYFFNLGDNRMENDVVRQFLNAEGMGDIYTSQSLSTSTNQNHRASMRIEYNIDSMNSLLIRPRFTLQRNKGEETSFSNTMQGEVALNEGNVLFSSMLSGLTGEADILWRHKFAKPRRNMSVSVVSGLAPKQGDNAQLSQNAFYFPMTVLDTVNQIGQLESKQWNASSQLEYTEPLTEKSQLQATYKLSYQQEESDRLIYDFVPQDGDHTLLNEQFSNIFSNDFLTHNGGLGLSYNEGRELNLSVRANYQVATLVNHQSLPQEQEFKSVFQNILPFASLRWSPDPRMNLRVFFRSSTRLPSIDQLQNVLNNQNPLQLRLGNPNLNQSESQNLFIRFQKTDPAKSRMFFIMMSGGLTSNQIVNSTWLGGVDNPYQNEFDIPRGAQLVVPVNLNGAWNARLFSSYGLPVNWLGSNLNMDISYNYQNNPGLVNGMRTEAQNHVIAGGVTISSNISDKLDFTLATRPAWNLVRNSLQPGADDAFISQLTTLRFTWQTWGGIVIRTDGNYQYYGGLTEGFNQNYFLWNMAIGKKILKNDRGEIALTINDILNQNRNISRSVTETWIEDTRTNALTQFFMLSFTYNLRHFGKAPEKEERRMRDN